jgi:hypothetical protein
MSALRQSSNDRAGAVPRKRDIIESVMEDVSEALRRLTAAGYADSYRAEARGLKSRSSGTVHLPETLGVDEIVRFEGDSDPSDECAIFALTSRRDGTRGTFTVAYGSMMDALDAEMVRRLATD